MAMFSQRLTLATNRRLMRAGTKRTGGIVVIRVVLLMLCLAGPAMAGEDYHEPARGSAERRALMDAIRPHAEWNLGQPIEFVVYDLRVAVDHAYASLLPQRPGGGQIDIRDTPMMRRGGVDPGFFDGVVMNVLYQRAGDIWVAVHWSIGATDVWWSESELCASYRAVTPEVCDF